jgi:hypothetical protein
VDVQVLVWEQSHVHNGHISLPSLRIQDLLLTGSDSSSMLMPFELLHSPAHVLVLGDGSWSWWGCSSSKYTLKYILWGLIRVLVCYGWCCLRYGCHRCRRRSKCWSRSCLSRRICCRLSRSRGWCLSIPILIRPNKRCRSAQSSCRLSRWKQ